MPENKPDLATVAEALGGVAEAPAEAKTKFDRDREAFDAIEKKYQKEPEKKPVKKAPKKTVVEKEQPLEADKAPEDVAEGGTVSDTETPESKKAREFLRLRASVPSSVIEKLSTEEAVAWAASSSKSTAEIDRAFMERADLQKELRDLREVAETEGEPSSAVPAPGADLKEITSQLSEQFGEAEADALTAFVKPLLERLDVMERKFSSAEDVNAQGISNSNFERLAEFVPLLAESPRAREAVEREVIALAEKNPKAFPTASDFFDDAVKALYGPDVLTKKGTESEPEPEVDEAEAKEDRKRATPTIKTKKTPPRKLPPKESDWQVFQHLEKSPGDIRGAQRAGRVTA